MKFIFTHWVYLQGKWVKFIYEGHGVKVKVTGAQDYRIKPPPNKS